MSKTIAEILPEVRARFAHVETCPYNGRRVFFENAGGGLTLKSVVETSAALAAMPDNQGRDNPASQALMDMIEKGRADAAEFLGTTGGQIIVGESGTELLFRLIRAACLGLAEGGNVVSATLEHPASRSAAALWAERTDRAHVLADHDNATGTIAPDAYATAVTPETRLATIIHTSPVTGMEVDVPAIVAAIRTIAPECMIIVDGIQHAAHGAVDVGGMGDVDAYVISPYKVFSRHGYGIAWLSDRLAAMPHDHFAGGGEARWELGTRDAGAYATFSQVVAYFDWLGQSLGATGDRRARLEAAGRAIHAQENALSEAMLHGIGNLAGLADLPGLTLIGGVDNPAREGLVSLVVDGMDAPAVVEALRQRGVLTHARKADHYSGSVLAPLGFDGCTRVSMCHYNSTEEVAQFLSAMREITEGK